MPETNESVLDRVLDPFTECLTPEVARRIAEMRADQPTQARVDILAGKANEGLLTTEERLEYERYLEAFHLITILQAKARAYLSNQSAS